MLVLEERLLRVPRFQRGSVTIGGRTLEFADSLSFLSAYRQIFCEGRYDYDPASVSEAPRILDCGANVGLATLHFVARSPGAEVMAFEPDPAIFRFLETNVARNAPKARVRLVNAAVWSEGNSQLGFTADGADGGYVSGGPSAARSVRAVRLRDFLDRPVGLLKLDVEGAELEILRDCFDRLERVEQIIVEHHSVAGEPQKLAEFLRILENAGFRLQVNNALTWVNPLVAGVRVGRYDQLLLVYGRRAEPQQT